MLGTILVTNHVVGNPQFSVRYEETAKPNQGPKSVRKRDITAALPKASIRLDTEKAGEYTYKFLELADANYDPKTQSPIILTQRVNSRPTARFATPGKVYNFCATSAAGEDIIPVILEGVPPFQLEIDVKHSGSAKGEWVPYKEIASNKFDMRIAPDKLKHGQQSITIKQVIDSRGCRSRPEVATARPRVQVSVHDPPTISTLDTATDFCVGEYLSFQLAGSAPFQVHYTFDGKARKADVSGAVFKRVAGEPGTFTIDAVSDSASHCKAAVPSMQKVIHQRPRGTLSKGRVSHVDIHEGHETDIIFDFEGSPPFEFTYTRSTEPKRGEKQVVLETKTETTHEKHVQRKVSSEGEYELISVKDAYCLTTKHWAQGQGKKGQKMLTN
jgi:nucleoporin POM152